VSLAPLRDGLVPLALVDGVLQVDVAEAAHLDRVGADDGDGAIGGIDDLGQLARHGQGLVRRLVVEHETRRRRLLPAKDGGDEAVAQRSGECELGLGKP